MSKLFDLTGRTAVVTGGAQGMGRAMATALAEAGADLVLLDRNAAGIEATADAIRALGRKALPIAGDVTDTDHLDRVFATVDREFGRVDILGNVAGEAKVGAAESMALGDIRATFHNLVISRYYTCQLAGQRMLAQGNGQHHQHRLDLRHFLARAGAVGVWHGDGGGDPDDAGAQHGVGRAGRAGELHPAGPGGGRQRTGASHGGRPVAARTFLHGIPAGRLGTPDDIKGLSVLLASDAASWITGAIIPMDGGNLAMNAGGGLLGPVMQRHGVKP